ncbi:MULTISPECIES: sulfur carrier protein ThiS [Clostridium]|uniref:Thiamine biosynthesis protein ThiS n=2 Tax=Clostridium novyi TaxID=1542 RepID=A0PYY1_CLONN|nr:MULTISPECIES: sulfur carrier protein ThiS [Clostridium]ABK60596.1 thiamine biosynthesis protein ThiS [Clostridium novyi NT]KEH86151.1 thiamine biosynthesis protein ThiS [Clostridium novyi A str. NCTC 538]KEH87631.1 thiamine biosynthesis protein ThiS [Clostridium novyi A str. 4540]KEH88833.1 thiamine biosynthesis protein ThiS [Clostridium novyi A str. BKT29909]KEH92717.1 thiamine biosynthesis protein ThiS [Clostridium botulinum C/D str. It1]
MIVNGEKMDIQAGTTVEELLQKLNFNDNRVVVEVDLAIVSKDEYSIKKLDTNSKVEIIQFVGGG